MSKLGTIIAALLASATLLGCGPKRIPGTSFLDTPDNEQIIEVIAKYKHAYEARDADAVLKLVSKSFYETNGTPDASDDYDYSGLSRNLAEEFKKITNPTLNLDLRKLEVKDADAQVNYYYTARFQLAGAPSGAGFEQSSDVAQIRLKKEGADWKIVSGI